MDSMHDIHRLFTEDLTQALGSAFRATGVEVDWPVFGAGMVYRPPDYLHPRTVILLTSRYALVSLLSPLMGTLNIASLGVVI